MDYLRPSTLSVWDTTAQSLGFVAPVMGVAFLTPLVALQAGGAAPLSMLLGGIGVLCIGLTIAQFAHKYPHAGSIYEYVSRTFGAFPGYLAGWVYLIGTFFLTAGIFPGLGGFVQEWFASHDIDMPWLPWALGLLVLSFVLQYIDVRFATRVQLVIVFAAAAIIFVFAIYVIAKGGDSGATLEPFRPSVSPTGWNGVLFGLIYAFLMYTGFEASAVLSEETKDARRTISITVLASVGIILVYFLVVVYSEAISYADPANEWPADLTPLYTMGGKFGPSWLVDVLSFAAIVDAIAVSVACSVTATRMLYALGRDGIVPRFFGRTHAKHKTPYVAIYTVLGLSLIYTVVVYLLGRGDPEQWYALQGFFFGGGIGSLALIIIYLVLSIAGLGLAWRGVWVARILLPVVGIVLTAFALYKSVYPAPPAPLNWMPYVLLALIAVGIVIGLVARSRKVPAMIDVEEQVRPEVT